MGGIRLSPKYGVNATIPVCFWCGKERGEIALMGRIGNGRKHEDIEAPMYSVIDFEPCNQCKEHMAQGFTVMEATQHPNQHNSTAKLSGCYPTGRYVVMNPEAVTRIFGDTSARAGGKAFLDSAVFHQMFMNDK